ncbi:hypothetical protein [Ligilactobacillus apodemi]|nr:hypothetical protein [Ligilactobacillus apodemi]MCR1901102.1 hypothetical protein [Ligilactobacillus apodemi]
MLELLATLIDAIWAENLYSKQVCTRQLARSNYNLKKLNVGSIYQDKYFLYDLIPKYLAFLTDISQKIEEDLLDYLLDYNFSYRVKSEQTTYAKIKQYFMREQRIGAIAVNKSLNDLIGFRIILVGVEQNTPLITELLCQKCNTRKISRFYFRDDGDYHAIHVILS